jgi:outer membrane protein assembly factor BamB
VRALLLFFILFLGCHSSNPVVWQLAFRGRIYAEPVIEGGTAYIVTSAGEIVCINSSSAQKIWEKKIQSSIVAAPAVSTTAIYIGTQQGNVIALEKQTGKTLWERKFENQEGFEAPLSISGDLLLAPSDQGRLYALFQATGETAWLHSGGGKYNTAAVVSGSGIFIGGWSRNFFCLRSDGSEKWKFTATDRIVENALPSVNNVYVPTHDKYVYCLDAPTGRLLWRFEAVYPTNLLLLGKALVFGSGSSIYLVKPENGQLIEKRELGRTIGRIAPSRAECLVITDRITRLDPNQKGQVGPFRLPGGVKPFKIVDAGPLYLLTDELYSIFGLSREAEEK